MEKIKVIIVALLLLLLNMPSIVVAYDKPMATVFNPITGHRKAVVVGDPQAFNDGYLLEIARVVNKLPNSLGYSVATNYSVTLSSSVSATQATIPVSSMTTKDNHVLNFAADLGSKVFLVIEPGGRKEEIIMCTGITSLNWTGCTRGLAFYGTSTAAITLNQYTHNAGSKVIMSNTHYVYDELVDKTEQETIVGDKTFTGTTTFSKLPNTTSTYTPTADGDLATKKYADDLTNAGAADATETVKGIGEIATRAEAAAGTSAGGTSARLFLPASMATSSSDVATTSVLITDTDGKIKQNFLDLTEGFNFTGSVTLSTTTVSNIISKSFGGTGSDGALNVTSGTTTLAAGSANVIIKNYSSINIAANSTTTISGVPDTGTILILRSQGDCTIAGSIDLVGKGATGTNANYGSADDAAHYGGVGADGTTSEGAAGAAGAVYTNKVFYTTANNSLYRKTYFVAVGAGGGKGGDGYTPSGSYGNVPGGYGGAGGGSLILECGGNLNFTGRILVDGNNGSNGSHASSTAGGICTEDSRCAGGSGGGGGSSGQALIIYNYLTANTGTIFARGGAGGRGGDGKLSNSASSLGSGGGGGGGGCYTGPGAAGAAGVSSGNGIAGGAGATAGVGSGGGSGGSGGSTMSGLGGAGGAMSASDSNLYLIAQNYYN